MNQDWYTDQNIVKPCHALDGRHLWSRRRDGSSFCRYCGETTDGLWAAMVGDPLRPSPVQASAEIVTKAPVPDHQWALDCGAEGHDWQLFQAGGSRCLRCGLRDGTRVTVTLPTRYQSLAYSKTDRRFLKSLRISAD